MKLSIRDYDNDDLETFQPVRKAKKTVEMTVNEAQKERDLYLQRQRDSKTSRA